jgi:DNA-binding beta-propeller fold protein YncE
LGFAIDGTTGALTPLPDSPFPAGTNPGSVTVDPSGSFVYVANVTSNDISAYAMDSTTGALTAVPGSPFPAEPPPAGATTAPSSVAVDPSGMFAYVVNATHSNQGPVNSTVSA